jgi:hydroxyacylglutathione hydrolase
MIIKKITVGPLETNCYIVGDPSSKEVFVIDPGADYEEIKRVIDMESLYPQAVINTHGHGDHIAANDAFGLPVWIHRLDAEFLYEPSKNLSGVFTMPFRMKKADRLLEEGDVLSAGDIRFEVIHTPGHTPGSICLKTDGIIFTGDTLFRDGVGRTDFIYGSEKDIMSSIKNKLFSLSDGYVIYPGHGPASSIGEEKVKD